MRESHLRHMALNSARANDKAICLCYWINIRRSQVGWATASPLPNIRIVGRNAKRRARPTWLEFHYHYEARMECKACLARVRWSSRLALREFTTACQFQQGKPCPPRLGKPAQGRERLRRVLRRMKCRAKLHHIPTGLVKRTTPFLCRAIPA